MANTSNLSDADIIDKYSRLGMALPAQDLWPSLFHKGKEIYSGILFVSDKTFQVTNNSTVKQNRFKT